MQANLTVPKRVLVSEEDDRLIKEEINRNPHLYRTERNQISEGELIRKATRFYLSHLFVQSNNQCMSDANLNTSPLPHYDN